MNWEIIFNTFLGVLLFTIGILIILFFIGLWAKSRNAKMTPTQQKEFGEKVAAQLKRNAEKDFNTDDELEETLFEKKVAELSKEKEARKIKREEKHRAEKEDMKKYPAKKK